MGSRSKTTGRPRAGPKGDDESFAVERAVIGVEDMVLIRELSEKGILENLKMRHAADQIYTFIGHVLVVVNPYKWLTIYDDRTIKKYIRKARIDCPPHVFAIAEASYRAMLNEEENQCIIISGESGAGKTEASKQIQNYIASISGGGEDVEKVKRVFLDSNPLLEAFGNAKTLRNNNSSRFGKYFELKFDASGRPQGGKVTNYLLEKSRVVKPGPGERNFHIFHQLLAGAPAKVRDAFFLKRNEEFHYLSQSGCYQVEGVDDAEEFNETLHAMRSVGLKKKQMELVLQAIAAILHLGNVKFSPKQVGDAEGSAVSSGDSLQLFCNLLGMDASSLSASLTSRTLQTMAPGGKVETYQVPQNPIQAAASRDGLAKSLYERIFDFLVARVNSALDIEKRRDMGEEINDDSLYSIGVLDIYGFEIFDNNGFEQFCINYVNEKLQQIFIELTLNAEQEEYAREGIAWKPIPFFNNKIVCELIEGRQPPGVFLILDDTIKTAHSLGGDRVDDTFLDKVAGFHRSHPHFGKRGRVFEIRHYAGQVQYNISGFSDATKDFLAKDITLVVKGSSNKLLQHLYPEVVDLNDKQMPKTAGWKIRTQCNELVAALMGCSPHYVRCIKSNEKKKAGVIDDQRVLHQIQYLGLLENIKVRRAGFAYRTEYGRFLDRFRILSKETYPEWKHGDKRGTKAILRSATKSLPELEHEVQLGKTMIFIRTPETYFNLERLREKTVGSYVTRIQRAWRKFIGRRHYLLLQQRIAKLYASHSKERRAASIFRPFDGDYVHDGEEKDAVRDIIDYYGEDERILFLDKVDRVVKGEEANSPPRRVSRLLAITPSALYLMQTVPRSAPDPKAKNASWTQPLVFLRRRILISEVEGLKLSQLADSVIIVNVKVPERMEKPDTSNWLDNKQAPVCMGTQQPFTMFRRRHHCRVTGKIFCDAVCAQTFCVPDKGFYSPVRVWDEVVGFFSTEVLEDQILSTDKKSEILGVLSDAVLKTSGRELTVDFGNEIQLRRHPIPELALTPAGPIMFNKTGKKLDITLSGAGDIVQVAASAGVPESAVRARRKREKIRRKKMEEERRKAAEERERRQAMRDAKREELRRQRVAEKKAKKAAERESRLSSTQQKSRDSSARKFGEKATVAADSGMNSELARALARRRGGE